MQPDEAEAVPRRRPLPPWHWALAGGFALLVGSGLLSCLSCLGIGDWDSFTAHALVSRMAVLEHGQLPTWNPYHCGGMSIPGNFQSRTYTPSFLLVLAFGPVLGLRLWALVLLAIGFEGARRLARALGAGTWGSYFAAVAIAGNGHVLMHLAAGHLALLAYLCTPWLLLGVHRGLEAPRRAVLAGAPWAALGLLEGGLYPMFYAFGLAGLYAAVHAVRRRSATPLLSVGATALASAALAAVLLIPSGLYLARLGTGVPGAEAVDPAALPAILLGLDQQIDGRTRFAGQLYWWHEYGTYVGPVFLLVFAAGVFRAGFAGRLWAGLGLLVLITALGDLGPLSPWSLLHHLPVFSSMRVPSRLIGLAVLCFALAASLGIDRLPPRLAAAGVGLFALNLLLVLAPLPYAAFDRPVSFDVERERFRQHAGLDQLGQLARDNHTTKTLDVLRNRGDLECYDPIAPPVHAKQRRADQGEALLATPGGQAEGQARIVAFSPARVSVALSGLAADAVLILNQNHGSGWQREDGEAVRSAEGRIGTIVTPQTQRVTFVHRPLPFYLGAVISLLSLFGLLRLARRTPGGR